MDESSVFDFFSRARRELTGRVMTNVLKSESPDFLADDSELGPIGIELTDARPQMSENDIDFYQNVMDFPEFDYYDAEDHVSAAIAIKESLRQRAHWQRQNSTILVVRVFSDLRAFGTHLEQYDPTDFLPEHGFVEVWVQDVEITFEKDGEPLSAAIVCLHPEWLRRLIYATHRHPHIPFKTWQELG